MVRAFHSIQSRSSWDDTTLSKKDRGVKIVGTILVQIRNLTDDPIQALKASFPCLRAVALQRASVKTGIQIENTGFPRIKYGAGLSSPE
jgi:hypothetical protein